MANKYLTGIKVIGGFFCVLGIIQLVFSVRLIINVILLILMGVSLVSAESSNLAIAWIILGILLVIISCAIPIAISIVGISLTKLKRWARKTTVFMTIFFLILGCIGCVISIVKNKSIYIIINLLLVIIYMVILYFLSRPKVKEQFR